MCLRRFEARGEVRGGRFVAALGGEQFALHEAVQALRRARRGPDHERADEWQLLSAADPLNLVGILAGTARVPAVTHRRVLYLNGVPVAASAAHGIEWLAELNDAQRLHAGALLAPRTGVVARWPRSARLVPGR
jgi:ATP-dependent Lhr-like helicase